MKPWVVCVIVIVGLLEGSVHSSFYGYQTYDKRALGPVYNHNQLYHSGLTFREAAPQKRVKPTYDFVSRPSYDYSINYGYHPTLNKGYSNRNPRHIQPRGFPIGKSSSDGPREYPQGKSLQALSYPRVVPTVSSYSGGYTPSTGGYKRSMGYSKNVGYGYGYGGDLGYQTRTTFLYEPYHYGSPYGKEAQSGEEEYEYTDNEDFERHHEGSSRKKKTNVDVHVYRTSYMKGEPKAYDSSKEDLRDTYFNDDIVNFVSNDDDIYGSKENNIEPTKAPYDPCEDLEEGEYSITGDFLSLYPGVDPQCNFVMCASMRAYLQPCSTGAKNSRSGKPHPDKGFCGFKDYRRYCGYATVYGGSDV